ncbi:hypothetical protein [Neobacillus kokaensis]|uniref:Lipoprotein n=1 Tax=Neobacillus kokaensis TaxID=2759023 RepID=A0ABQ3N936_9BACI|nr:hypothetical protein [Neobacillus kokaensis]GHI00664.1 hypothetical protein AM1BK_42060 [Neobacillus kokaensis]
MKNKLIFFVYFLLLIVAGCQMLDSKTLTQFYEKELNSVSKIIIVDGNTGYRKTITDKELIDDFLNKIKDIKFIPDENQEQRDGFNYSITLFDEEKETFQFGLTQVNDTYYHTEHEIYPIVDQFYKNNLREK